MPCASVSGGVLCMRSRFLPMLSRSAARPSRMARTCATGSVGSSECCPLDAAVALVAGEALAPMSVLLALP
eukprot:9543137-Alexandrium_andersonii.AAC.1